MSRHDELRIQQHKIVDSHQYRQLATRRKAKVNAATFRIEAPRNRDCFKQRRLPRSVLSNDESLHQDESREFQVLESRECGRGRI
jgi:hypothetical protein